MAGHFSLLENFSISRRPYSFLRESFNMMTDNYAVVESVWVGKTRGEVSISMGVVGLFVPGRVLDGRIEPVLFDEWLTISDSRAGGMCEYKWDGKVMWSSVKRSLSELVQAEEFMDPILKGLPEKPAGSEWTGWYSNK